MEIVIQRRAIYYVFNLIVPCILISGMALLVFTLPPGAGEKISLGVTILLSLTMFLQLVADKLPQTSEAIPLIGFSMACSAEEHPRSCRQRCIPHRLSSCLDEID
ncbi:Neuronal acetylcholine receptor subunit alpha-7 [Sparganum proliferum]